MAHRQEQLDVLADYFEADAAEVMPILGARGDNLQLEAVPSP
jgi:hypothetical protein